MSPSLLTVLILVLLGLAALPAPSRAQRFGQWWWEGVVGAGQRQNETLRNGEVIGESDQQELRLSLGLNGYLGHPALGEFHLGLDLILNELRNGRSLDTDRTGFDLDFNVLPRSSYPVRVFVRRRAYDYAGADVDQPLVTARLPETTSQAGARVRLRKGKLKGSLLGIEHSMVSFSDPDSDDEVDDRAFFDWGRKLGGLQHHVRLERHYRDFGFFDFTTEDLVLNVDQQGYLTDAWGWQLTGIGILRDTTLPQDRQISTDDLRFRNRLYRDVRKRDRLDIFTTLSSVTADGGSSSRSWSSSVFYRWRPRQGIEVAPFAELALQRSDDLDAQAPRAGVSLSWSREGAVDTLVTTETSYATISRDGTFAPPDENRLAFAFSGSISHGEAAGLSKELEVMASRNQLRLNREPILDLPDLGSPGDGLSTEDMLRVRLTLGHRWRTRWIFLRGDWSDQQSDGATPDQLFSNQTTATFLNFGGSRYTLQATMGETQLERGLGADEKIRFDGITGTWRPWRFLDLRASYRTDERRLVLTPDMDTERLEFGTRIRFGQITLEVNGFQTEDRLDTGNGRENRGFTWSISRRFSGWLPVVTGTQRRGVIR